MRGRTSAPGTVVRIQASTNLQIKQEQAAKWGTPRFDLGKTTAPPKLGSERQPEFLSVFGYRLRRLPFIEPACHLHRPISK
jgi:hypothetical protein